MNLGRLKRKVWFRYSMRGAGANDPFKQLDTLYRIRDPWNIDSKGELPRLTGTNDAFRAAFGHVGSLLEVGSGEGVQSAHLATLCDTLTGIDVVPRALRRARKRLPGVTFFEGQLKDQPWAGEKGRFDAVVAAEVLNYMADPRGFIDMITALARKGCLITYFSNNEPKLGPIVRAIPSVRLSSVAYGDALEKTSVIAWWPSATSA